MDPASFWGVVGFAGAAVLYILYTIISFVASDCDLTLRSKLSIPDDGFEGSVVWITGASSGIGKELAIEMAKRKATLIVSARRKEELEVVAQRCRDAGSPRVKALLMDVMDLDSHKRIVAQLLTEFKKIDILVNNAGTSQRSLVEESDIAVDRELLHLNVLSPISLTKAVLPSMLAAGSGHIVVTSSTSGKMGFPTAATYSATKHACQGFFDSLRMEVADRGIKVSLVCPGPVVSEIMNHAYTKSAGKPLGYTIKDKSAYVDTNRCGFLFACAIYHQLAEVWIAKNPVLLFMYAAQYAPSLARYFGSKMGPVRVKNYRAGNLDHVFKPKSS